MPQGDCRHPGHVSNPAVGKNTQKLVAHQESSCSEMYFMPVPLEQGEVSSTTLCWPLNYCHGQGKLKENGKATSTF